MTTETLKEIADLIVWTGKVTPSELQEITSKRQLSEEQLTYINELLKDLEIEIQEAPRMILSNKKPYAYIAVNNGSHGVIRPNFDYNTLAFILCFIYVSNQRADLDSLLLQVDMQTLNDFENNHFIEISRKTKKVAWGVRARMSFSHEDVVHTINKVYSKDMATQVQKAGLYELSYEVFKD